MEISAEQVKKLRDETGSPVMEVRAALQEAGGDPDRALEVLRMRGVEKLAKRAGRETSQGLVETYVHAAGKIGSMVQVACETDFVARTEEFKSLAKELAMQVAAMNPQNLEELLEQEYIRDPSKKVKDLVTEVAAKTGENVQVKKIARFALGE